MPVGCRRPSRISGRSVWNRSRRALPVSLSWAGLLPLDQIPQLDRSSHLLYSSDINPACPNSVIEALACGLPVVAFDTGALPEIVLDGSGLVVPYGGDPWKLASPDIAALAQAAIAVLANQDRYRLAGAPPCRSCFRSGSDGRKIFRRPAARSRLAWPTRCSLSLPGWPAGYRCRSSGFYTASSPWLVSCAAP